MNSRSPERSMRRSQKQAHKPTSNSQSQLTTGGEKRLKSLDSRSNIQNRHLLAYQMQSTKEELDAGGGCRSGSGSVVFSSGAIMTTTTSLSNHGRFKDQTKTNDNQNGSRSVVPQFVIFGDWKVIGERLLTEDAANSGQQIHLKTIDQDSGALQKGIQRQKRFKAMQVFVRVRPLNQREIEGKNAGKRAVRLNEEQNCVFVCGEPKSGIIGQKNSLKEEKVFEASKVFGEESLNKEIFDSVMSKDIKSTLFEGFNCTCFVYGMTGAGKTYTMFGDICNYLTMNSPVKGLIMLSLQEILAALKEQDARTQVTLRMSYLEIYNEQIRDLLCLNSPSSSSNGNDLMVVEDPQRGVIVPELTEIPIMDETQVLEYIRIGNTRRQMAATGQNEFSSRSHALLSFTVESTATVPANETEKRDDNKQKMTVSTSKLCLVDLAGSERAAVTENRGIRLQEGANINKSLLALGNCINILGDTSKKGAFVPYRDSKLTRLLKDSLGGNTQTYMIACISPSSISVEETVNTLKYAQRARRITKTVTQNVRTLSESAVTAQNQMKYISLIESMKCEIDQLKSQLAAKQAQVQIQSITQKQAHQKAIIIPLVLQPSNSRDPNLSPVSNATAFHDGNSFFSDSLDYEVQLKNGISSQSEAMTLCAVIQSLQEPIPTTAIKNSSGNYQNQLGQGGQYPLHSLWEDQESFSSSGKSVRISCANTSNNASVILFKRSPSQLKFTKPNNVNIQQLVASATPQILSHRRSSLSSSPSNKLKLNYITNNVAESRPATERSGERSSQTDRMELLSCNFIKNLEENWEIQQSIFELKQLQQDNEQVLSSQNSRLKQLRGKLIQWVHENEISEISTGVAHLQDTMLNNATILTQMQEALLRNEEQKKVLQDQMVMTLSSNVVSEGVLKQLSHTCELLKMEKSDLHNANLEIKQQHSFIHSQFLQKMQQIKSMQLKIKEMQASLDQKNSIITQNQLLLQQLLPQGGCPPPQSGITVQSATTLRSTSSKNSRNKKFVLEKQGYFDFKSKQTQNSLEPPPPPHQASIPNLNHPTSPSVRLHNPKAQIANNNNNSTTNETSNYFQTKKSITAHPKQHSNQQQKYIQTSQKQNTLPTEPTESINQPLLAAGMTTSSARLSTTNNKSVGQTHSVFDKHSIQTHREKHPLNKYSLSSLSYQNQPNTAAATQKPITNTGKYSYSMITPSTVMKEDEIPTITTTSSSQCLNPTFSSPLQESRSIGGRFSLSSASSLNPSSRSLVNSKLSNKISHFTASKDPQQQKDTRKVHSDYYRDCLNHQRLSQNEEDPSIQIFQPVIHSGCNPANTNKGTTLTSNEDDLESSVSEFLKTDEFPEFQIPNTCKSLAPHPNQHPSIQAIDLLQQQYQPSQSNNSTFRSPLSVNLTLRRTPQDLVSTVIPLLGINSTCQFQFQQLDLNATAVPQIENNNKKENQSQSVVGFENNTVSIHKIDLYRDKNELPLQEKEILSNNSSNNQQHSRSLVYSISQPSKQLKSPLRSNNNNQGARSIGNSSSTTGSLSKDRSIESSTIRLPSTAYQSILQPSSHRIKSVGVQNVALKLEDKNDLYISVSPPQKANASIAMENQKHKIQPQQERNSSSSQLASNILIPPQPLTSSLQHNFKNHLNPLPLTPTASSSNFGFAQQQAIFQKQPSPAVPSPQPKQGISSTDSSTRIKTLPNQNTSQVIAQRAQLKPQFSSINLKENEQQLQQSKLIFTSKPSSLFPQQN